MPRRFGAWVIMLTLLGVAAPALAHVERTSYWPDPRPDTSVNPPAGGTVPKARSLASALDRLLSRLEAGPSPSGGFVVSARFPLERAVR